MGASVVKGRAGARYVHGPVVVRLAVTHLQPAVHAPAAAIRKVVGAMDGVARVAAGVQRLRAVPLRRRALCRSLYVRLCE